MGNIFYIVTDLKTNETTFVNSKELLEEITGWARTMFNKMRPGEKWIINNLEVICEKHQPHSVEYYKNLWREEELNDYKKKTENR